MPHTRLCAAARSVPASSIIVALALMLTFCTASRPAKPAEVQNEEMIHLLLHPRIQRANNTTPPAGMMATLSSQQAPATPAPATDLQQPLPEQPSANVASVLPQQLYTCQLSLNFAVTASAIYSGSLWTSSIYVWLPFSGKENPVKLTGRAIAEFQRSTADGRVQNARQWYQTGTATYLTQDTEILYTAARPLYTNPLLVPPLAAVSFVTPPGDGTGWTLDTWTSTKRLYGYTFTYTATGVKGALTLDPVPVALSARATKIAATVRITAGRVTVHYAGMWGGQPDIGDMLIDLAGTSGPATGCTVAPKTDYPPPTPNPEGDDLPPLPGYPLRKLRLDCSAMTVQLAPIDFTYEDSQWPGMWYDGILKLKLSGVKGLVAEGLFNDAVAQA